mmetsp:Transcript_14088/g.27281  ORF Transcript_14088/g.27281 Transcript_14088/m.27281 type:complete len:322 (+) Transcript_14088:89-1054(+)|eukprot:CAMPEP_0172662224 /NCGR_PEP_ID=MMETSP1074-20121228/5231_1 /TAXON_ID=2916 /ORGANISM="Ceratium fusus, Strain PA161109" /LENGTH=321 /DNA_ID=CAMNT_0013478113 /DNA_START=72 /DNA_END=1037 /DNA_ORIENTATION=-
MDPVGPEGSKGSLVQAHTSTSRAPTEGLADANAGSCTGSRPLHPELQARLQRMGIRMRGDAAPVGTLQTGPPPESGGNQEAKKSFETEAVASNVGEMVDTEEGLCFPSAKDANLDDMLLQLSDLDARSRALQAQSKKMTQKLDESKKDHGTTGMASARGTRSNGEATPRQLGESRGDKDAVGMTSARGDRRASPSNAAQAIVKQHPLQSLTLLTGTGDFQRHGTRQRRHERPPMAPSAVPGVAALAKEHRSNGRRSLSLATAVSIASAASGSSHSLPPPPSSARGPENKCDRVALPPLKPSTSAPGRLNGDGGPWARCRGR